MAKRKSNKKKLEEHRCTGYGPDYVPFYEAREGGSRGSASRIPDPIEGRMIHCLSDTESMLYYLIRWKPDVKYIREQYLLDNDLVNKAREELRLGRVPETVCYTTDFLVDLVNGEQIAYSVKYRDSDFLPISRIYRGRQKAYANLIERQNIEIKYWEAKGTKFKIITRDTLMEYRILIKNIAFVMKFWNEDDVVTPEQMLLYFIAHHIIEVPMDKEFINPRELMSLYKFDVKAAYKKCLELRKEAIA